MNAFRRLGRELNAYRCYLRDGYTEWAIVLAIAGILLSAGDSFCSWLLGLVTPSLASRFDALEKGRRVLLVSAPCATVFLAATIGVHWWEARRRGDLRYSLEDSGDRD